jgi:predicted HicB family RNase H-like nuclease
MPRFYAEKSQPLDRQTLIRLDTENYTAAKIFAVARGASLRGYIEGAVETAITS